MKKKIGYLFLILISVLGSRLIFGKDYHLNSDNLIADNLYLYDIFSKGEVSLTMLDDEYIYYVLKSDVNNKIQYDVIKYNLISNKITNQYTLTSSYSLKDIKMFDNNGYLYLTAINSNIYYQFNKKLELVNEFRINSFNYESFAFYNDNLLAISDNNVFYQDNLYDSLPNSCGKNTEIIYGKNTYLHFHNSDTGFGCLYNIDNKKREYLDYEKVLVVGNKLLEYQDNRQSFKYDGVTYYFNDITESNNLKMHINGDYLFTIDMTNFKLRIYNPEVNKIIKERSLYELKDGVVKDILIGDYVYFTIVKNHETKLYIWDYLKEARSNKDMISYNEKEYKFKNNELKEELKKEYNVSINIYDQAVSFFPDAYVIPSYDDILINSRLIILKDILKAMTPEDRIKLNNLEISFEKSIMSSDGLNSLDALVALGENQNIIAINVANDNFKSVMIEKLNLIK